MAMHNSLPLLLVLGIAALSAAPAASKRVSTRLPTCKRLLAGLSDGHIAMLRDAVQMWGQTRRKAEHWRMRHSFRLEKEATATYGERAAYAINMTIDDISREWAVAQGAAAHTETQVHSTVDGWRAQGMLPANAVAQEVFACVWGRANPQLFDHRPRVSIMMQYFKRPWVIQPFVERITACNTPSLPLELIVNVDSQSEAEAWVNASRASGGVVVPVFSGNVHEIRAYNRLAHISRGEVLILMADDDLPPANCDWLNQVLQAFDRWPAVGVVGIRRQNMCYDLQLDSVYFRDPSTGAPMQWVQRVDMAPMAFRRNAYLHVGGFDETLSEPGDCGILSDWEICGRMWTAGWQVITLPRVPLEGDGREGGTHKPETGDKCWGKQQGLAGAVMGLRGSTTIENEVCHLARQLNLEQLQLIDEANCPYANWQQKSGCSMGDGSSGAGATTSSSSRRRRG